MTAAARRRRHLVMVTITFHPEPGAMRGLPLASRLVADGAYDVTAVTAIPWYPLGRFYDGYRLRLWQWESVDGVRILRLPLFPSHDRSAARRVATYVSFMLSALLLAPLLVRQADVVYHVDNLPTTGLVTCLLRAVWRAPVVQHIGDLWPDSVLSSGMVRGGWLLGAASRALHAVQRFVYARNAVITVLSEGFRRILAGRGLEPAKLRVSPNWADEDAFAPVPRDPAFAERLGLAGRFSVVYAGNVGPMQALDVVARAAARLADLPDVEFVVVGDGPSLPALRAEVEARGLTNVRLLGRMPVADMARLNACADALLVHLKDEPFLHATVPSKLQVGLLAGRPLLLGARGDAAEILAASGGGHVFPPEDDAALASAVRALAAAPAAAREAMGARGRAYYDSHLSMAAGVATMRTIFDEVAAGDRRPVRRAPTAEPAGAIQR